MPEDVVKDTLREAYDRKVDDREARGAPRWQLEARDAFMALLCREGSRSLLELGAATGTDGVFFEEQGLKVTCIDLSPEMVRRCRQKGLDAHVMHVADLDFPDVCFDAVYAMNCLVHLPKAEMSDALAEVRRVSKPSGLFYLGLYGGYEHEGTGEWDPYEPKRFFSFYTDEHIRRVVEKEFEVMEFECLPHGWAGLHFQSLTLRRRP